MTSEAPKAPAFEPEKPVPEIVAERIEKPAAEARARAEAEALGERREPSQEAVTGEVIPTESDSQFVIKHKGFGKYDVIDTYADEVVATRQTKKQADAIVAGEAPAPEME